MYWIFLRYVNEAEAGDFEEARTHAGKANSLIPIFVGSVHENEDLNSWFSVESLFQQTTPLPNVIQLYKAAE